MMLASEKSGHTISTLFQQFQGLSTLNRLIHSTKKCTEEILVGKFPGGTFQLRARQQSIRF